MTSPSADPSAEELGPPGKVRPFSDGLILTMITLGIYSLVWHHRVHAELMRYLGRPNGLRSVWTIHVSIVVAALVFAFFIALPILLTAESDAGNGGGVEALPFDGESGWSGPVERTSRVPPTTDDLMRENGLYLPAVMFAVGLNVSFAIYVMGQHLWLFTVRKEGARAGFTAGAAFLALIWIGSLLDRLGLPLGIRILLFALPVVAYYNLQSAYNELWAEVAEKSGMTVVPDAEAGPAAG